MKKIRVHFVATSFDSFDGGLQQSAERIALLISQIENVEIYTYSRRLLSERVLSRNDFLAKSAVWGTDNSPLIEYKIVSNLPSEERYRIEIINLKREVSKNIISSSDYENIIISLSVSAVGFVSQCVASDLGIKHIVSARGSDFNRDTFTPGGLAMFKFIFDNVDYIVTTNSIQKTMIYNRIGKSKKIKVIYNSVVDSKEYLFLREKYVPNQTICIFSDCGLSQKKGSIYLLSAIKELLDNQYKIKLILVGCTEISRHSSEEEISNWKDLCTNLETIYPQYMEFHDKVSPEEVKNLLRTSDIYISPSLGEGCSNSVNKALLTGIPCIITDTGAAKEITENDKNVVFIEPGNIQEIKDAIINIAKNINEKKNISDHQIIKKIAETLSSETEKKTWENILFEIFPKEVKNFWKRKPRVLFYLYDGTGLGHLKRCCAIAEELQDSASCMIVTGQQAVSWFVPERTEFIHIPSLDNLLPEKSRYWRKQPFINMTKQEVFDFRSKIIENIWKTYSPDIVFTDYLPFGRNNELLNILEKKSNNYLLLRGCLDDEDNVKKEIFPYNTLNKFEKLYKRVFICCDKKVYDLCKELPFINSINIDFKQVGYAGKKISKEEIATIRRNRGIDNTKKWVVCSAGGGAIGEKNLNECIRIAKKHEDVIFDIIYGPKSGDKWASHLYNDYYEDNIHYIKETPYLKYLHAAADIVITSGGYNSIVESLSGYADILVVPSQEKRTDEQWMHARKLSNFSPVYLVEDLYKLDDYLLPLLKKSKKNTSIAASGLDFNAGAIIRKIILEDYYGENNI